MVKSVLRVRCSPYYAHLYLDLDLRLRKGEKFICLIISQNVVVENIHISVSGSKNILEVQPVCS